MDTVIILEEIENKLNVKFPKTFHEIYRAGAMEWLKHSYDWLDVNRETVERNSESFFYRVGGDCEPVVFSEIQETINYFEEMLEYDEDYKLGRVKINPIFRDELIYGDFILFNYCGHSEDMYIKELDSLEQLEKSITSNAGFTNPFTTYQVAIIKGEVKDYNLYFTNGNDGEDYKFIKDYYDVLEGDAERRGIPHFIITNVRLEWLL